MDPLTGVATAALLEGVKFLYQQAAEVLSAWRARRRDRQAPPPTVVKPPGAVRVERPRPLLDPASRQLGGNMRFAFRHFPLTGIHPHALAAAAAAEAAALQGRFWDMHELLFHRQKALEGPDLLRYAARLGLDVAAFDRDRTGTAVADRIRRDVDSGLASGQVLGTPTLFIDGLVHRGGYDPPALLAALAP